MSLNNSPWTNTQTNKHTHTQKVSPQTPFPELGFKTLEHTHTAYYCRSTEGFKP